MYYTQLTRLPPRKTSRKSHRKQNESRSAQKRHGAGCASITGSSPVMQNGGGMQKNLRRWPRHLASFRMCDTHACNCPFNGHAPVIRWRKESRWKGEARRPQPAKSATRKNLAPCPMPAPPINLHAQGHYAAPPSPSWVTSPFSTGL